MVLNLISKLDGSKAENIKTYIFFFIFCVNFCCLTKLDYQLSLLYVQIKINKIKKELKTNRINHYLRDITAAAKETPEIELKFGNCDSTKCTEAKIMMKYVSLIDLQLGQTVSWNFFSDFPPVTM